MSILKSTCPKQYSLFPHPAYSSQPPSLACFLLLVLVNGIASIPLYGKELDWVFLFLGLHVQHMVFPRLGVELELQPPATATATWDLSHVCDLHHSSRQPQILNLLRRARVQSHVFMDTSWVHNR